MTFLFFCQTNQNELLSRKVSNACAKGKLVTAVMNFYDDVECALCQVKTVTVVLVVRIGLMQDSEVDTDSVVPLVQWKWACCEGRECEEAGNWLAH